MIDLIPSKDVRDYIKKTDWKFTDFEKAAIIFNLSLPLDKRDAELQKIADAAEDEALRAQIAERLEYERECHRLFRENAEGYMYATEIDDGDGAPYTNGYFVSSDLAYEYGKKQGCKFSVEKYQIVGYNGSEPLKSKGYFNPNLCPEPHIAELEYDGGAVAGETFDKNGRLKNFWSGETEQRIDCFDTSRFERAFINMPNPFEAGDIVRHIGSGMRGIVATSQEDWKTFIEGFKAKNMGVDFFDVSLIVDFALDNGRISHRHINPIFLEKYEPAEDDIDRNLLMAANGLYRQKYGLEWFTSCYDDYKKKCKEKERDSE